MTVTISPPIDALFKRTVVWDNHACMPLRPEDDSFLPQLERHRRAGATVVSLNVCMDMCPPGAAFLMLAQFRRWIAGNSDRFTLAGSVADIEAAKASGKLAIMFDVEGGKVVEGHLGMVEILYLLGVRWMLIAYNRNNALGAGCQDEDEGLTDYGRLVIREMERVGMVLCCSHTGYQTALEAIEHSNNPTIFSHSNPRALWDHPRNIPDELMLACAAKGGVININGLGIFLGNNDSSTSNLLRHIEYAVALVGPAHVGLGLDFCFDYEDLASCVTKKPDIFPRSQGYREDPSLIEPERLPEIAEAMLRAGFEDDEVQGIMGHNNLRIAQAVWK